MKKSAELVSPHKLQTWLKTKQNVLFEGKHGVGKTSIIIEAFKKAGLRYLYFSGATMDPFIDFIGVPVKVGTKHGEVIKLLQPEHLVNSNVQAIFIDEFNRTHKKVRNAVMELIQFKTINGKPLSKDLRVVWAAINPDNAEGENDYDTDHLDPAQRDRFQIHVTIPYVCSLEYFTTKFGEKTATTAIKWWNAIDEKVRDKVSPRRLEYALTEYKHHGDIRDVLPPESNVSQLLQLLKHKGKTLDDLIKSNNIGNIKTFFEDENNYNLYIDELIGTKKYRGYVHLLPAEKIAALLGQKGKGFQLRKIIRYGLFNKVQRASFAPILIAIESAGGSPSLTHWAKLMIKKFKLVPPVKKMKGVLTGFAIITPPPIPKPKSSLGTLIQLMLNATSHQTESQLTKKLSTIKNKTYSLVRMGHLLTAAKVWLKKNGYNILTSTQTGGMIVQEAK
jgi:hypothetical protein